MELQVPNVLQQSACTHNDSLRLRCRDLLLTLWQQQEGLDAAHGRQSLCRQQRNTSAQHGRREHVHMHAHMHNETAVPVLPTAVVCFCLQPTSVLLAWNRSIILLILCALTDFLTILTVLQQLCAKLICSNSPDAPLSALGSTTRGKRRVLNNDSTTNAMEGVRGPTEYA